MRIRPWLAAALAALAAAPAAAQAPRWSAERDLVIGGEAEPPLSMVVDATVGPDGNLYVVDVMENAIRVFDPRGRHLRSLGRTGEGPGEFRSLWRIGFRGDTLYAVDGALQRVTLYGAQGRVARTLRVVSPDIGGRFDPSPPLALLPDGWTLVRPGFPARRAVDGSVRRIPVFRMSRTGEVGATLAWLAFTDPPAASVPVGENPAYLTRPVSGESLLALAPDGASLVVVDRPVPAAAGAATFRVTRIAASGDTLYSRAYRYAPVAVPRAAADSVLAHQVSLWTPRLGAGRARETLRRALRIPRYQAPVTRVALAGDGTVWLRREELGRARVEWMALDRDGHAAGVVQLPAGFLLRDARPGEVWGVELDELDVPSVVRYRLRPAAAAR